MTCNICLDEMDMIDFRDTREGTSSCHKLECGHAFHTKCIVKFLTNTQHKCPACNLIKTPQDEMNRDGAIKLLIKEVLKEDPVKIAKHEYVQSRKEYIETYQTLAKEIKEYAQKRASELRLHEKLSYYKKTKSSFVATAKEVAIGMGPRFVGAVYARKNKHDFRTMFENQVFGKKRWNEWRIFSPRYNIYISK